MADRLGTIAVGHRFDSCVVAEATRGLKEAVGVYHRLLGVVGLVVVGDGEGCIDDFGMVMYVGALVEYGRVKDALIRVGAEGVVMDTSVGGEDREE